MKFLVFVTIVIFVCLLLQITPVADAVAKATGSTGDKIKSVARTILMAAIGVALVSWGIAALGVPVLGVGMVIIGLVVLGYTLWPVFKPSSSRTAAAGVFNDPNPFRIFI